MQVRLQKAVRCCRGQKQEWADTLSEGGVLDWEEMCRRKQA
jgi:hypothetical protein